jgi:hypothetical protein
MPRLFTPAALLVLVAASGCALQAAAPPPSPAAVQPADRGQVYERFKLSYQSNALSGSRWKRADGEYAIGQLDKVLSTYPESAAVGKRIQSRGAVLGGMAAIGGAVLGFTFGANVLGPEKNRWSSTNQAIGYGVGAGLCVGTFLLQALWTEPGAELVDTYNKGLKRDFIDR